jgi:hypothetical protein
MDAFMNAPKVSLSRSKSFRVHRPDRSVPTPVTDSGDDRPISGHGNGFAKLHAHDGAGGSRKSAATTGVVIIDRWREMLMASERVTPRYACRSDMTTTGEPGGAHLPVIYQPVAAACQ